MANQPTEPSTRRGFLLTGGAAAAAGLLAGCSAGGAGNDSNGSSASSSGNESGGANASTAPPDTANGTTSSGSGSYSVTMAPVGRVTFDAVPERWVAYTGDYADMGVALGKADGLAGIGVPERFGSYLYDDLPGVSVNTDGLTTLYTDGTGKEVFYELDADVHVVDPNFMTNRLQWSQADVEEITDRVAPFFGNTIFTRVYGWHDYRNYSLDAAFEKVAAMFRERERYEAFTNYTGTIHSKVSNRLPDESPSVAVVYPGDVPPTSFYPYRIGGGTQSKQWRTLQVTDALKQAGIADAQASGSTIDYEALLDVDPDVLAVRLQGEVTDEYFQRKIVEPMRNDDVASRLSAVENDRVIYGGLTYQGPIIYLFQLERAAQGLYPDEFGGEQLFDRTRVARIVTEGR